MGEDASPGSEVGGRLEVRLVTDDVVAKEGKEASSSRRDLSSLGEEEQLEAQCHRCAGCGAPLTGYGLLFGKNYSPCRYLDKLMCKQ